MVNVSERMACARQRFLERQDGTATVEAVLWIPIFLVVFGFMVDVALIFDGQSRVLRVVHDANRNMSIGRFTQEVESEAYIAAVLDAYDITPTSVDADLLTNPGYVSTVVTIPADQFQLLGYFTALLALEVDVTAEHILDDWEA